MIWPRSGADRLRWSDWDCDYDNTTMARQWAWSQHVNQF